MILGLIILYFIGKKFAELAEEYDKNKWGYGILGIVIYYAGILFMGMALGVVLVILDSNFLETANNLLLNIIAIPIGLLSCYLLYLFLEKKWEKEKPKKAEKLIDEIGRDSNF